MAIVVPLVMELVGVIPPSFVFEHGRLVLLPRLVDIPPSPTLLFLLIGNLAMVLVPSLTVGRLRDQALDTKRTLVATSHAFDSSSPTRPARPREAILTPATL